MRLLIDQDMYKYRAAWAAQKTEYDVVTEDVTVACINKKSALSVALELADAEIVPRVMLEPVANALSTFKGMVERTLEALQCNHSEALMIISGPTNFRNDVATILPYKGNRDKDRKPVHGPAITEYTKKRWKFLVSDNEEADDTLGWMQDDDSCICTQDKDLDMIPGLHYNFVKEETYMVTQEEADRCFWEQLIVGDLQTDNIQGIVGTGVKGAKKALSSCTTNQQMLDVCHRLYVQAFDKGQYKDVPTIKNGWEALEENAKLIWIRREENELWTPSLLHCTRR